ncbi:hypothetical protein K2173_007418 [Erythroxylum novogranatense]|uniref:DUF4005 domain-containing protein n=1 Tax=Erythroxylum novogranatense TaxID=1862640 RepID=A0AAV8T658_9ROSI|nr:hypothetical protein K2173_007418 [Erythroxylum novogranatense]
MGRSSACLKIIACSGTDSADRDDLPVSENKSSSDKRGWSFRKRSARHRVLNNTVISEVPSSASKDSPESANLKSQVPDTSFVPEKISVIQCTDEKPQLSNSAVPEATETIVVTKDEGKVSETIVATEDEKASETNVVTKDEGKASEETFVTSDEGKASETVVVISCKGEVDVHPEESAVCIIQTAIRGLLAKSELLKLRNVIKLQAAVRGHIVRQHAMGSLRCVQAIVKMQALVRAHQSRLLLESDAKTKEKEKQVTKPNVTYTSIGNLLSNRFAQQLMASTPKTKHIRIKCDPMKPNSAWNWLEMWMSVLSTQPSPNPQLMTEQLERETNETSSFPVENKVAYERFSESAYSSSDTREAILPSHDEENLITLNTDNFTSNETNPSSSVVKDFDELQPEVIISSDVKNASTGINSLTSESAYSDLNSQIGLVSLSHKLETESKHHDQPKRSMKRSACEQLETEAKKSNVGSSKSSSTAFIAAQSKFEELTSTNSHRSISSPHQEGEFEPNMDAKVGNVVRGKEPNMIENLVPQNSRVQYVGSECGTELSVTSTLDSPDISEVGVTEQEHENKFPEEETSKSSSKEHVGSKNEPVELISDASHSVSDQPELVNDVKRESENSNIAVESTQAELKPKTSAYEVKRELDSETGSQAYRSSPEASPRSHITVPESQGTPSSQISVAGKKSRTQRSGSNQKRKSLSAGKRSNLNHESHARSIVEQLAKDEENGKRRNSFGSTRPDPTDEEPRDTNSGSSIPHFMQATESARAKIHANNSPRSSPDVQDRDYIKKRHSLPGANGKQGSPRIQQPMSQAHHQGGKGNTKQVHDKKWQR